MDNELVYSADATYQKAQYDASAKRLLGSDWQRRFHQGKKDMNCIDCWERYYRRQ